MITVSEFPEGDWILSSLGGVSRSRTDPLLDSVSLKLAQVDVDYPDATPKAHVSKELPVSRLPEMKVGTIWRNGKSVGVSAGLARTQAYCGIQTTAVSGFAKLFFGINPNTPPATGFLPALSIKGTHFPWKFPGQNDHGQNAIVVHTRNSDTGQQVVLVIPCWEIVRFYFCTSAFMSQEIFRYGLVPINKLYDEEISRWVDGHARLVLRNKVPRQDSATVLRIAFDETAAREARNCAMGILVQLLLEVPAYPKIGLPFSGTSELKCLTKRCQTIHGKWVDFVLHIKSCTAPFPGNESGWRGFQGAASAFGNLKNLLTLLRSKKGDNLEPATNSAEAEYVATLLHEIEEIVSMDVDTFQGVADHLNLRGITTLRGKKWRGSTVGRLLSKAARHYKKPQTGHNRRGYHVVVRRNETKRTPVENATEASVASSERACLSREHLSHELGEIIRKRREEIGLSRRRLAERAGICLWYLRGIEAGQKDVPLHIVNRFCAALDLSFSGLLVAIGGSSRKSSGTGDQAEPNKVMQNGGVSGSWGQLSRERLYQKLGEIIRKRRIELDFPEQHLVLRMGLSRKRILAIEAGHRNVKLYTLGRLCAALGLEFRDLASPSKVVPTPQSKSTTSRIKQRTEDPM